MYHKHGMHMHCVVCMDHICGLLALCTQCKQQVEGAGGSVGLISKLLASGAAGGGCISLLSLPYREEQFF